MKKAKSSGTQKSTHLPVIQLVLFGNGRYQKKYYNTQ